MLKEFATDDHAEVIEAAGGSAFQYFERSDAMTKSASDVISKKDVNDHMPPDGHFGIHLIATGAESSYGSNRNGDSFSKEALEKYHPTFEKFGCVFREHKNKCQRTQGVGQVKLARFNPKMARGELIIWVDKEKAPDMYKQAKEGKELSFSMSCFPAGSLVMLPDGSQQPIEEIQCGDYVLSHKGRACRVSSVQERDYVGELVNLRPWGLSEELIVTADHPVWARTRLRQTAPCPVCGKKFKLLKAHLRQCTDAQHARVNADYSKVTEGFWPAHYLAPGDLLRTAVPTDTNDHGNEDLAIVAGFYLAEGSLSIVKQRRRKDGVVIKEYDCKRVEWTFGIHEQAMANLVADCVARLGHTRPGVFHEPKYSRIKVASCSRELFDWLMEHCGKYSYGKRISPELMAWRPELQRILIGKWLDGDGHWCNTNHIVKGVSVSANLAMQMTVIAARCGISATLSGCTRKTEPILGLEPKSQHRRVYAVGIHKSEDFALLQGIMTKLPAEIPRKRETWTRSVSHLKHQKAGQVATLTRIASSDTCVFVEGNFIYRKLHKARVGYAALPVYDLTVEVDHGFQVHGVGVSNCRLPFDRCSCCDNKAKRTASYCNHLKHYMNRYVPEFRKYAYARNEDDVKFFDISEVKRRADRIATFLGYSFNDGSMSKAAAEDTVITGAEWAEHYGKMEAVPFAPWEAETLRKMAAEVSFIKQADAQTLNVMAAGLPQPISHQAIERLAKADFRSVGGELAKRAMILDFASFASLITGLSVSDLRKQADFRDVEGLKIPELLEGMQQNDGCECGDEAANAVAPDEYGTSFSSEKDSIDQLLDDVGENLGLKPQNVTERALTITIKMASMEKQAARPLDPVFSAMAEAYGHYLVKAAHIAKDAPGVSQNMLFRSIAAMQIFPSSKRLPYCE